MFNLDGRIGGDTALSERGEMYAKALPGLVLKSVDVRFCRQINFGWTQGKEGG